MCRIGSIKSKVPIQPSKALHLMLPQQEGHDNSGFAMVMQDLYGIFSDYKDKPLLSLACTQRGAQLVEDYMDAHNFVPLAEWIPVPDKQPGLDIVFHAIDRDDDGNQRPFHQTMSLNRSGIRTMSTNSIIPGLFQAYGGRQIA